MPLPRNLFWGWEQVVLLVFVASVAGRSICGMKDLSESLTGAAPAPARCKILHLNGMGIGDEGVQSLAKSLGDATVKKLFLHTNKITDAGMGAVLDIIRNEKSKVDTVLLANNELSEAGISQLANALAGNSHVRFLSLDNNTVGDAGAIALADALRNNDVLTTIMMSNASIGNDGAQALAGALGADNSVVEHLDLGNNDIGVTGMQYLGEALGKDGPLKILNLNRNYAGDAGSVGLGKGLATNTHMRQLFLQESGVQDVGAQGLLKGTQCNMDLQTLDLGKHPQISKDVLAPLVASVGVNSLDSRIGEEGRQSKNELCKDIRDAEKRREEGPETPVVVSKWQGQSKPGRAKRSTRSEEL